MADGRMLRKKISRDPQVAQLSDDSKLLFTWAIAHADREGRIPGLASWVRGTVVPLEPWTDEHVDALVSEWERTVENETGAPKPLALRYCVRGEWAIQLLGWTKNQSLKGNERPSELPAPPEELLNSKPELKGSLELNRRGTEQNSRQATPASSATSPPTANGNPIRVVYDHWRTERSRTDRRYERISDARRQKIAARLREFTVDELKSAISAVALDPWEDRPRHDDLTVILRSREQVERFLAFAEGSHPKPPATPGKGLSAEQIFRYYDQPAA